MDVEYKTKALEKICTIAAVARKKYGSQMADEIQRRIDQISVATSVEQMVQFRVGRCHPLHQNREGQYAVDLVHPQRLIFEKKGDHIQIAYITEITDYHR